MMKPRIQSGLWAGIEALREHVADNNPVAFSRTVKEMGASLAHVLEGQFQLTCDTDMITLHYVGRKEDVPIELIRLVSILYVEDPNGNVVCEKHRFQTHGRYNVPPPIGIHPVRQKVMRRP